MKAILIDAAKREIREVEYNHTDTPIRSLIGGWIETAWSWPNGDVLYVDEEGLLKPQEHFFLLSLRSDGQPLAGNGVLVGREVEDDTTDGYHTEPPTITVDELRKLVRFIDRKYVNSWGAANSSEPMMTIMSVGPGGAIDRTTIATAGEVVSRIPVATKPKEVK